MAAGDFDYGGAAFMGPLLTDYNVSAPRELMQVDGKYWFTNFAQPLRGSCEPPPGATGLASSENGLDWERASSVPLLDTFPAHGAQPWEQNQIYAPNLVVHNVSCEVYPHSHMYTCYRLLRHSCWCPYILRGWSTTSTMPTQGILSSPAWLRCHYRSGQA